MKTKKILTVILYLYKNSEYLTECLKNLACLDENLVDVIIYQDKCSEQISVLLDNFFKTKPLNFTYIKSQEYIGQSYCFNQGIQLANSEYVMFELSNNLINKNLVEEVKKLEENVFDVISFNSNDAPIFKLENNNYSHLEKELILNNATTYLWNKLFNLDFLKKNELFFDVDNWFPDAYLFNVLLKFNTWHHIKENELIYIKDNFISGTNLYDYLFQINEILDCAERKCVYHEFKDEIDFWIIYICLYKFLAKIYYCYGLQLANKTTLKKNAKVIKLAIKQITKEINKYVPHFKNLSYFVKNKTKVMKYFIKSEKIAGWIWI